MDAQDERTFVGVVKGRIQVQRAGGVDTIDAGEQYAYDGDGARLSAVARSRASPHTNDPFFDPAPQKPRARRWVPPLRLGAKAERMARAGRGRAALVLYDRALADPGVGEVRTMIEYGRARLLGFVLGRPRQARAALDRLTRSGDPEVALQARLAICELDRDQDPRAARRCSSAIDADDAPALLWRWSLRDIRCGGS